MEKIKRDRSLKRLNEVADADQQEIFQRVVQVENGLEFLMELQKLIEDADCDRDLNLLSDIVQNFIAHQCKMDEIIIALNRRYGVCAIFDKTQKQA